MWRLVAYAFILLVAVGGTFRYHDVITGVWELFEGGVRACDSVSALAFSDLFDLVEDPNNPAHCLIGPGSQITAVGAIDGSDLPVVAGRTDVSRDYTSPQTFSGGTTLNKNDIIPDDVAVAVDALFYCGPLAASSTRYYRPAVDQFWGLDGADNGDADISFSSTWCTASFQTTSINELLLVEDSDYKVMGMVCRANADMGGSGTECELQVNDAPTVPPIKCTMISGERSCVSTQATTDNIEGGAIADKTNVRCTTTADETPDDVICKAYIAWQ